MIDWLDKHLVPHWRQSWRWASVQANAVLATIAGLFGGQAAMIALGIAGVTSSDALRIVMIVFVALVWFIGGTAPRLWKQEVTDDEQSANDTEI